MALRDVPLGRTVFPFHPADRVRPGTIGLRKAPLRPRGQAPLSGLTLGEKRSETEDKDKQFSERFSGRFERRRAIRLPPR